MKSFNFITDGDFLEWYQEVSRVHKELAEGTIPLTKENILMEHEVCELLGVTARTLRKYRQQKYLGFVKMEGLIFYLKPLLYLDLFLLYYRPKMER
ncbi:hypothetical protein QGN23_13620 [Chryseobacterium gotjawalense]|uniref:DNA-binding protein n=1 Tax=Chryseobacterium gotjawalense TaxID=3042315 RepID=A0ABY8RBV7_9FLAO|nr:hypothetical protein [Chryseobacterium sp. wdc7]WHF51446.1 hypothetical protein QGN23_13620 [Chryseobacterium sp. wdc7]